MKSFICFLVILSASAQANDIFTNQFESLVTSRVNTMVLKDPHVFFNVFGCNDLTFELNNNLATQLENDEDGDGFLDINLLNQFKTDQPNDMAEKNQRLQVLNAACSDPLSCVNGVPLTSDINTQFSVVNTCLEPLAGTTSGYSDGVTTTQGPCYVSEPVDVTLDLNGLVVPMQGFQQAARYTGGITKDQGLIMGFVSEATAQTIIIPESVPVVGGATLYELLPGGGSCAAEDDRDLGPDGVTSGWWFYFNSTSDLVVLNSL